MTALHFKKVVQTQRVRPARWDAWDTDGNYYQIRYRFGVLRVLKEMITGLTEIRTQQIGGPYDGELTTEAMLDTLRTPE